jgi:hypothetical protein
MKTSYSTSANAITILILVAQCFGTSTASAEERLPLSKGMYRLQGVCTRMNHWLSNETGVCANRLGIDATDPALPQFIFPRTNGGGWIFVTSKPAVLTQGGNLATYQVSSILDMTVKRGFAYEGECVLDMNSPNTSLTCTLWKDEERQHVSWDAQFTSGIWEFSRAQ